MLIDTHCHLNFTAFDQDLEKVINRAVKAGVKKFIIPGAKIDSSQRAVKIAQENTSCFAAVGVHPHHVNEYTSLLYSNELKSFEDKLESLAKEKKVVAIGEIGMDYHEYKGYPPITDEIKTRQKELLLLQIKLALKYNLPAIFHCRDSHDDMLELMDVFLKDPDKQVKGVFHCFGGGEKHLEKVLEMGFCVGFDGNITYPANELLRKMVQNTPLDRLLLETDSPYLTPDISRGQRNEPSNLLYLAKFVAGIRHISLPYLTKTTSENACRLFQI